MFWQLATWLYWIRKHEVLSVSLQAHASGCSHTLLAQNQDVSPEGSQLPVRAGLIHPELLKNSGFLFFLSPPGGLCRCLGLPILYHFSLNLEQDRPIFSSLLWKICTKGGRIKAKPVNLFLTHIGLIPTSVHAVQPTWNTLHSPIGTHLPKFYSFFKTH